MAADGHTSFINIESGSKLKLEIIKYLDGLQSQLVEAMDHGVDINQSGELLRLISTDVQQILTVSTHASSGSVLCVRNMLLENAIRLEKTSGFSALISTLFVTVAINKYAREYSQRNPKNININDSLQALAQASRRASGSIALKAIRQYCKDPLASSIVIQACNMSGHSGHIYVDNTPSAITSIELTGGYTFNFGIEKNFQLSTKLSEWKVNSPKILLLDGVIETVGEINRLLEYMHEKKQPCVIIARGFSNEVLGTLSVNKSRETLDVIPVLAPFDLEGINALADLGVVCQSSVVSSLKGDAISAIDPDTLKTVDSVTANHSSIVIQNAIADQGVKIHIDNLLSKKNETSIVDKKELLDKRTKALGSVCTHVRIAGDGLYAKHTKRRIQHGINMLKNICRYGSINLSAINCANNDVIKSVASVLLRIGYEHVSAREFVVGLKCGETIVNNIFSSSTYAVIDERDKI